MELDRTSMIHSAHPLSLSPHTPTGGNPDSNTLLSDMTTVICLDDYHCLDRNGRKEKAVTALDEKAQNFDLMYEQVKALREGKAVDKPIYNHVSGLLDPPERIESPKILVIEGLHPFYDQRVQDLLDLKIYLDISDEIKFAWKVQRDMAERGHSLESIKASIESRKPDFDKFVDPQKKDADIVIQVLPTQLIPDEKEGKVLRVRMIQKVGKELFDPAFLFDEGSTISWIPCGRKLTCSFPGIKFFYGPDEFMGEEVVVLEVSLEVFFFFFWEEREGKRTKNRSNALTPSTPTPPTDGRPVRPPGGADLRRVAPVVDVVQVLR
jgi:phosphoribulokinase